MKTGGGATGEPGVDVSLGGRAKIAAAPVKPGQEADADVGLGSADPVAALGELSGGGSALESGADVPAQECGYQATIVSVLDAGEDVLRPAFGGGQVAVARRQRSVSD
jgi:hypothetical protein